MSCDELRLATAVEGDDDDDRLVELTGIDSIDGATLTGKVWRDGFPADPLTVTVHDPGTPLDPDDPPVVRIALGPWLATAKGGFDYYIDVQITIGSIGPRTWPSECPARLRVRRTAQVSP